MGIYEMRAMLGGVSRERVHQLTRRPDFPKPIEVLRMGKIWTAASVEAWIAEAGRSEQV